MINIYRSRRELPEYSCCLFSPDLHPSTLSTTALTIFLYFPCRKPQKNNKLSLVYKWKDWKAHNSLKLTVIIQQLPVRVIMHKGNDILQVEHFNHVHNFEVMDYEMWGFFPWYLGYCNLKQSFATWWLLFTLSYIRWENVRQCIGS